MVDFAGWSMPVQYASIVAEHQATRRQMSLFDVSHMGRLCFEGDGAAAFLDRLLTRRVSDLGPGEVRYSLLTNEQGGILDDVLIYHLQPDAGRDFFLLVVNAGNREKVVAWIRQRLPAPGAVRLHDGTLETAMIAVQGPQALAAVQPGVPLELDRLRYYSARTWEAEHGGWIVSRTGYTGEDGVELIVPATAAEACWETVLAAGQPRGAVPAGLGARDTLRLEAGMPLYGHELSEQINPYQAGLKFAVDLEGRDFPGRDALARLSDQPPPVRRVGLELSGKRVPREHYPILAGDAVIGEITSGTFSPTFDRPLAMGYLPSRHARVGEPLAIDVRGQLAPARVVRLPFYTRHPSRKDAPP